MSPALLGFLRGLGTIILTVILAYVGDASHLNGLVSAGLASVIAGLALSLEHMIEAKTGRAGFGMVRPRTQE